MKPRNVNFIVLFIAIFLLIVGRGLWSIVINSRKVDDWVYNGPVFDFDPGSLSLMPVGVVILLLLPFFLLFGKGLWLFFKYRQIDMEKRALGIHKILLSLPVVSFFLGISILAIDLFTSFSETFLFYLLSLLFGHNEAFSVSAVSVVLSILSVGFLLCYIISSLWLVFAGIIRWRKNRHDVVLKKRWRNKFIFGILSLVLIVLPATVLFASLNSGYSSYDGAIATAPPGVSLGNSGIMYESSFKSDTLGFSVGGAKDINSFRENINNDFLPLPTDITYEGLYYDYYFDTGETEVCTKLFCPSYSTAVSQDPFSGEEEYFLSVGLNSGIKESDFARKKLNLVVVLDISGSMGSSFNEYYYDKFGKQQVENWEEERKKTKMKVASESVAALLDHLNEEDSFGMVLFDSNAYLAKPLRKVNQTDINSIKDHILEIRDQGGTNMSAGMDLGTNLFEEYKYTDPSEYENRIIFLTDAMPNLGDTSKDGLFGRMQQNADDFLHTTFVGIGLDFNTELMEKITKVRGANYYSINSSEQFKKRMDEEFDFMVTPLVFDLMLEVDSEGFEIAKVYGSPEADEASGTIMKVNTLFPSVREEQEVRGGLVLLHMKKISDNAHVKLTTSYVDRSGVADRDTKTVNFDIDSKRYSNTGIRKGILLARYANILKNWMIEERDLAEKTQGTSTPIFVMYEENGIIIPREFELGEWERTSLPLQVENSHGEIFKPFVDHFEKEKLAIGDDTLQQELDILTKLIDRAEADTAGFGDPRSNNGQTYYKEFQYPYPLMWKESTAAFSLVGVTYTENTTDDTSKISIELKIRNEGDVGKHVRLDMRYLLNEEGDYRIPKTKQFTFSSTNGALLPAQSTDNQTVEFSVPQDRSEHIFTTGGQADDFFSIIIQDGEISIEVTEQVG